MRVIVVDDEDLAREALVFQLQKFKEIEIVAQCNNGITAVKEVKFQIDELFTAESIFLCLLLPIFLGFFFYRQLAAGGGDIAAPARSDKYGIVGLTQDLLKSLGSLPGRALIIGARAFVIGEQVDLALYIP